MSFSVGGWAMFAPEGWTDEEVLATYNTRIARYFMEVLIGQGDSSAAGTAARNYVAGLPLVAYRGQSAALNMSLPSFNA